MRKYCKLQFDQKNVGEIDILTTVKDDIFA